MLGSTRTGKLLVAVIHDTEVSRAMGINVDRMYLYTFTFGSLLAAIGGAFTPPTVSGGSALGGEDRKSGVEGKRVDLGGRRIIKKKKKKSGGEKRRGRKKIRS